jgi:protein involved in polysaccharide export with SLBB domain
MAAGETIDDLIVKAGGYTDNAYPFGAVFQNREAKKINKKAQELLYQEFLDNIIALSQQNISGNFDLTPIVGLTKEINDSEVNGRMVVDIENEDSRRALGIQEGDSLIIPEKTNTVYVYGEVSSEGSVMYEPNQNVNFFIEKSGGYKKYADNESIYILHPNGETDRYSKRRNIFESQPRSGITIYPGSVIFVPKEIDNSSSRALAAQAYVTILGNLGLALASLNSISSD